MAEHQVTELAGQKAIEAVTADVNSFSIFYPEMVRDGREEPHFDVAAALSVSSTMVERLVFIAPAFDETAELPNYTWFPRNAKGVSNQLLINIVAFEEPHQTEASPAYPPGHSIPPAFAVYDTGVGNMERTYTFVPREDLDLGSSGLVLPASEQVRASRGTELTVLRQRLVVYPHALVAFEAAASDRSNYKSQANSLMRGTLDKVLNRYRAYEQGPEAHANYLVEQEEAYLEEQKNK